ncbi:hypothetical protein QBC32DRAFT_248541 [Pseudoneurospora amorphoporcata]|uniref:Uncharacterized protein n=1 Tax=Pseudoneurospora amorphoporcata TaxID=241081 RepID=A0AAN6NJI1_9PEZI|nr:hypothetical protein QBC32DRAFT_248541 [Pseudoneurospora amorphoporcata]
MEIGSQHTGGAVANTFADESQSDQITLFLKQLDSFERAPRTFLKSWKNTQEAEYNSTARIFFDEGQFPAWLVYFLTKNAADKQSHFLGKAELRQFVNALEKQSVKSRQLLAARVGAAIPPKHLEKINSLHKRTITSFEMSSNSKKRRRADSTISENSLSPDATPQSAHGHHSSLGRTVQVRPDSAASSNCCVEDERVPGNASLEQAERLFPRDLFNSIKRYPDPRNKNIMVAAVLISFPNEQCQMSLEVTEDKVQHLARDLFDARLEVKDGFRYLRSGRTKVKPSPKLTLTGCERNVLSSTFGLETFRGIEASSRYQHEGMHLWDTTDCVAMVISASAQEGAVIYMSLGLWEGIKISNKLFQ